VSASPLKCVVCTGGGAQQKVKQPKGRGKAKAGIGGGPSSKAGSSEASTSQGEASRPSTVEDAVQAVLPKPTGGSKRDMQRMRKERQRQRRIVEAREDKAGEELEQVQHRLVHRM
jgi:hypothetical protein